jgi:hypothetical protein
MEDLRNVAEGLNLHGRQPALAKGSDEPVRRIAFERHEERDGVSTSRTAKRRNHL